MANFDSPSVAATLGLTPPVSRLKSLLPTLLLCWLVTAPAAIAQPSDLETRNSSTRLWEQLRKLTASDASGSEQLGFAVAISGDTAVVGAPFDDDAGSESGSAYIFERNEGGTNNWGEVTKLIASDAEPGDEFGNSVSISDDTLVVAAHRDDTAVIDSGSVYIFERNEGGADNWGEVTQFTSLDAGSADQFGFSVAIRGDTVIVGAPFDDGSGSGSGSAYLFGRNEGGANNWGEVIRLAASDAAAGDQFGFSVGIDGETVIVGAPFQEDAGSDSGAAYVFDRNEGGANNWGEVIRLTASDAASDDWFGHSVGISGETVIVGALLDDDAGFSSGSAYLFERNEGGPNNWGEVSKLTASDAAESDRFGHSVAMNENTVIVGAIFDNDAGAASGAAYVFDQNEGGPNSWGEVSKLTASDAAAIDQFGHSVAISRDTVVVGARFDGNPIDTGSAYVFEDATPIFTDSFESGDTSAWSSVVP